MEMAALEVATRDNTIATESDDSLHSRLDTSLRSASSGCDFADVSADASQLSSNDTEGHGGSLHTFATFSDKQALQIAERVASGCPSRRRRQCSPRSSSNKKKKQELKACMLSMKGQVAFLHEMMKQIGAAERESFLMGTRHESTGDLSGMSFSLLSPVRKSSTDLTVLPDAHFKKQMLLQDEWELDERSEPAAQSSSFSSARSTMNRIAELERENAALKDQIAHNEQHTSEAVAELLDEIEDLKRKLRASEEAHGHVQSIAQDYEQTYHSHDHDDAADSSTSTASCSIHIESNQIEHQVTQTVSDKHEGEHAVIPENPTNTILANHERCQEKIHELWQTIKNLKVYVETYRIEMDDLKSQRNEAVASAERAWKDNAKLAGNTNPQQKIKYLQAVKNENAVLTKKIRELQSQLAALRTKKAVKKANSVAEPQDSQSDPDRSSVIDESVQTLFECEDRDDESEPERSKLFQKMWHHNKELEAEILRLRQQKQALDARRSRSEATGDNSSSARSDCLKKSTAVVTRGAQQRRHHPHHLPSVA